MIARNTSWRQGSCLTLSSSYALGLLETDVSDKRVVIISHDCDLPNDHEELIEIIIGSIIAKVDPNYAQTKNIRRLHIQYENIESSQPVAVELTHSKRQSILKESFAQMAEHDFNLALPNDEKRILKQWLAMRYGRAAFPNAFESRMKNNKKFEQKLADKMKPHQQYLVGIFFDLGEERSIELPLGSPYFLNISIVYHAMSGSVARQAAETCANNLMLLFHKTFGPPSIATDLVLESCHAVADTHFSLADIRKSDQWRVDYISLREEPPGVFLAAGQAPS